MNSSLSAAPPTFLSRVVSLLLAIKPLAHLAKQKARQMMITRSESIGVPWRDNTQALRSKGSEAVDFDRTWDQDLAHLTNPSLTYPPYYVISFHGYDEGNLGWLPAMEVESASRSVHAKLWPDLGAAGDAHLRSLYHDSLHAALPQAPRRILDLGCGAGLSTFALGDRYPEAAITGLDLSPYFLAVAQYRSQQALSQQPRSPEPPAHPAPNPIRWLHGAAETTGLPDQSFDLVSIFLVVHELPQAATLALLGEAHRLLAPGGHFALMDMNPSCEFVQKLPPYVLTLLKSTEPYLDDYFSLDLAEAVQGAGFEPATIAATGPRHRTLIAAKPSPA
ncbi:class I SAM-dependent methyltransferase [Prochlorothrix hollandica]|uniref:class I SAM-dependent methyltransferase n=1 Tax=Prochlorothrix hollandica TaxID=1223 RepID=UPI003341245A